jgi:hypothetical protein
MLTDGVGSCHMVLPAQESSEFPETRISPALILAQRIVDLFDQAEATPHEQQSALDVAGTIVLDRLLYGSSSQ